MKRNVPTAFLNVVINWYSKMNVIVRWNNSLSAMLRVKSGVRQGGVLSPYLFNVYADVFIKNIVTKNVGCHTGHTCIKKNHVFRLQTADMAQYLIQIRFTSELCTCLEDVLRCSVWHYAVHVQRWEQLQAVDTLFQRDSPSPFAGHQSRWLHQEEPRVPSTDGRRGSVSHSDKVHQSRWLHQEEPRVPSTDVCRCNIVNLCFCSWFTGIIRRMCIDK